MATPKNMGITESASVWKKKLSGKMNPDWERDINNFETELFLKKQGKIEDKVFAETRLRMGAYGQRYDNGKRHDGKENRPIPFPDNLTKGPMTLWDAPGMERIKLPWGGMNPDQMDVLADLAEEYSDAICHVTTRQDIQLHFVHIEDCPSLFRRLAAVGITTREACGNSVRNVTACPIAGVCNTEAFDVTPYAEATFRYLLGHPDVQDFGRKFKIAFSGCKQNACGLVGMHDLGFIAAKKNEVRGFEMYVGGGLGAVPYQAKLFTDFVAEDEFLALTQAVCRVYARLGEKKNRNRARIKFLVNDLGIEKFRELVLEERKKLSPDPRWNTFLESLNELTESPFKPVEKTDGAHDPEFARWKKHNAAAQKQKGYFIVTIALPLGDITSNQMRALADIARQHVGHTVRTTVEQNIVLRWVREADLYPVYEALKEINLADPYAGTIVDVTACPGTDTCKLGVSSSRGLAGVLREHLAQKSFEMDEAISNLRIKVSGCFNSCSQQHVADIGFYGISRKSGNYVVPHFQLLLGGKSQDNAGSYGMVLGGIPSKAVPKTVDRLAELYLKGRNTGESFQAFIARIGKVEIKKSLMDLMEIPAYEKDSSYYVDWGSVREFTTSDIGKGECAGEIVSLTEFGLKAADRELFEAQIALEAGDANKAGQLAFKSMVTAAQGMIKGENPDISDDPKKVLTEFKTRFLDTQIFNDPFAGAKFAHYFLRAFDLDVNAFTADKARKLLEESQLFIDAAYACNIRMSMGKTGAMA